MNDSSLTILPGLDLLICFGFAEIVFVTMKSIFLSFFLLLVFIHPNVELTLPFGFTVEMPVGQSPVMGAAYGQEY